METAQSPKNRNTSYRTPVIAGFLIVLTISTFVLSFLYFQKGAKQTLKNQAPVNSPTSSGVSSPTSTPTLAPTPTPLQGPGRYACDPLGICNDYSDEMRRENCTVTYADSSCLYACADPANRCKR